MNRLSRLLNPGSIALYGGSWSVNVLEQLRKSGFDGDIWPVHPKKSELGGRACYPDTASLPGVPDAAFLGVNRELSVSIIKELSDKGAGGAICFASGFAESNTADLQDALVKAAGDMPFLGPNCYGFLNYLDNVTLWPDQHGGQQVDAGVGIIAQSSNIAINLTMQKRGLDIGQLFTIGNQAAIGIADLGRFMLADERVKAIGLYLEGFGDIRDLESFAVQARSQNIPVVILKTGKTEQSRSAAISHTASLSGSDKVASAFIKRLGFYEVETLAEFLECLKFLQILGPLPGNRVASVSCSGGEASLMSDLSRHTSLSYPQLSPNGRRKLNALLGDKVDLANPLDYHTYIWGDVTVMTDVFSAVMNEDLDLSLFVLDIPRADQCDPAGHDCAIEAIIKAKARTGAKAAVIGSLPENLEENVIERFIKGGVVPLLDMQVALRVVDILSSSKPDDTRPVLMTDGETSATLASSTTHALSEYAAKQKLRAFGIEVPKGRLISGQDLPDDLSFPIAAKVSGLAHKSETGGVILGIENREELESALKTLGELSDAFLIEEMIGGPFVELIVGALIDPTGIWTLTIGAGGVLTELLEDSATLTLPTTVPDIETALSSLKLHKLLAGYRGKPAAHMDGLTSAILKITQFIEENKNTLIELDINPLAASEAGAVALDALIIEKQET